MRKLRQLSMAVVLTFTLATCGLAGIIPTVPEPAPPPPPDPITFTGTIETPPSAQSTEGPTDPVVDVALALLQSVLTVF